MNRMKYLMIEIIDICCSHRLNNNIIYFIIRSMAVHIAVLGAKTLFSSSQRLPGRKSLKLLIHIIKIIIHCVVETNA